MKTPQDLNFTPTSTNKDGTFRTTRCGKGQSVYDAVREGIEDGWFPPNATVGPSTNQKAPANAISQVTVRSKEAFWIVV